MDQQQHWPVPGTPQSQPAASPAPGTGEVAGAEAAAEIAKALEQHLAVCNQLLELAQKESEALKSAAPFPAAETRAQRITLLNGLKSALTELVHRRTLWYPTGTVSVTRDPQVARLVTSCLDTIMRILVLDRENEEQLLRRGLLPARSLPAAGQARPHFVAGLYQRHGQPPA